MIVEGEEGEEVKEEEERGRACLNWIVLLFLVGCSSLS